MLKVKLVAKVGRPAAKQSRRTQLGARLHPRERPESANACSSAA
jgi:hypothetical protein